MPQFTLATPYGVLLRNDNTVVVTNTTTETTIASMNLPAGMLSMQNRIKFTMICTLSTLGVLPGNLTIRVKYGSGVMTFGGGAIILTGGASNAPFRASGRIANKASTSAQTAYGEVSQGSGGLTLGTPINQVCVDLAVNSTAAQTFAITAQFGTASASNVLTLKDFELDISQFNSQKA